MATAWCYSLRWCLSHQPCPGAYEIDAAEMAAGYVAGIDFGQSASGVRRWSKEAKSRMRLRNNLTERLQRQAPLYADESFARETAQCPGYYAGENVQQSPGGIKNVH